MNPRVALVVTSSSDQPVALVAGRLRRLLEMGWDAHLFCDNERFRDDRLLQERAIGARVVQAPKPGRYPLPRSLLRRPGETIRFFTPKCRSSPFAGPLLDLRPDLVHFHSGSAAWRGIGLKTLLGCRAVVSFRTDGRDFAVPEPEAVWNAADLLVFPTPATLDRAAAAGFPRHKSEVLDGPLLIGELGGPKPAGKHGPLRLYSSGSLSWEHGFEHSVHAVRILLDMGIPCEYRIVGGGEVYAVAFARHQLGLADRVDLIEPDGANQLAGDIRAADVVIDPAVTETVSSAPVLTAQALGVPFVATRRAGLPEKGGIVVPRRDPKAIAETVAKLARDPGLREKMGRAGRATARPLPTLDDDAKRLDRLYRKALGQAQAA